MKAAVSQSHAGNVLDSEQLLAVGRLREGGDISQVTFKRVLNATNCFGVERKAQLNHHGRRCMGPLTFIKHVFPKTSWTFSAAQQAMPCSCPSTTTYMSIFAELRTEIFHTALACCILTPHYLPGGTACTEDLAAGAGEG
eukprot:114439-Pelagomonas_calceolata.AAC.1